ncbi:MAG: hypothetical protein EBQ48_10680 [Betaproteobacteria bacterium]|nr:hypothetical protein [Betaproteobacteria bacterium]
MIGAMSALITRSHLPASELKRVRLFFFFSVVFFCLTFFYPVTWGDPQARKKRPIARRFL